MKKCLICEKEHSKRGQCCSKECSSLLGKQTCLKKYGVENVFQSKSVKKQIKQTMLEKYGVEHPLQSEKIKTKVKQTNLEKYGVESHNQANQVKEKKKQVYLERYGVESPFQSEEIRNKVKQTNLERYGVEHNLQSEKIKKQIKQTMLEKYGVEHPLQSEEIKEKVKQTCLEKYGFDHPLQSEEVKNKYKETCLERYGVESPFQSEEIRNKVKQTNLERYGVENHTQSHIPKELLTQDWWDQRKNFLEAKELIGNHISESKVYLKAHQFRPDWEFNTISQPHQAIIDYLNQTGIEFTINDRDQIKPFELDIWIPSKNLGIEVDGVYWHSLPEVVLRDQIKDKLCEQQGIKLLRFTDVEIIDFFEKCKNQIGEFL